MAGPPWGSSERTIRKRAAGAVSETTRPGISVAIVLAGPDDACDTGLLLQRPLDPAERFEVGRPALLLHEQDGRREDARREPLSGRLCRLSLLGVGRQAADRREAELQIREALARERDDPEGDRDDYDRDRLRRGELRERVSPRAGALGRLCFRLPPLGRSTEGQKRPRPKMASSAGTRVMETASPTRTVRAMPGPKALKNSSRPARSGGAPQAHDRAPP